MPRPKLKKNGPSIEDETPLWEFIYENVCKKGMYERVESRLFGHYLEDNELPWSAKELAEFYSKTMEPALYKATLDVEKILALYKRLEIEIEPHVEKMLELRSGAGLRLDSDRFLVHYEFYQRNNKRRLETPKEVDEEEEDEVDDPVEVEQPIRKKVRSWPSPVRRVPEKTTRADKTPVRNTPAKNRPENTPQKTPRENQTATSTSHFSPASWPLDVEISEEFNKTMWNHVRANFSSMTAKRIMSVEFWAEMLQNNDMEVKSPTSVLSHFHGNQLKKLWKQNLDPSIKMRLMKELTLPMNRAQQRWLFENEGVDVQLTDDGYIESWEVTEETPKVEPLLLPPPPPPPRHINTWVPRPRPEIPLNNFDNSMLREPSQSRQSSVTSRAQSVVSHNYSMNGMVSKCEDDLTISEKRRERRVPFTYKDDVVAWKFILNQMYDPEQKVIKRSVLPKGRSFWDAYIREMNSSKTSSNWCSHYRKKMMANLHTMPFSKDTIFPLYKQLEIPITPDVRNFLEKKFVIKLDVDTNGLLKSLMPINGRVREHTHDTESLVNDDEETDGESATPNPQITETDDSTIMADEITKLSTASTASVSSTPQQLQPCTSFQSNQQLKRRKSNESDHQIKRRSVKLIEIEDEDETDVPVVIRTEAPKTTKRSEFLIVDTPKKRVIPEYEEEDEEEEDDDDVDEDVVIEPLDLKEFDGNFMGTHELLNAIKSMICQSHDGYEVVNEGVRRAFTKNPADKKPNIERIARNRISESLNKSRGHASRVFSSYKHELVAKTVDCCENQEVFRKRISQTTKNLDRCLQKLVPPDPPFMND